MSLHRLQGRCLLEWGEKGQRLLELSILPPALHASNSQGPGGAEVLSTCSGLLQNQGQVWKHLSHDQGFTVATWTKRWTSHNVPDCDCGSTPRGCKKKIKGSFLQRAHGRVQKLVTHAHAHASLKLQKHPQCRLIITCPRCRTLPQGWGVMTHVKPGRVKLSSFSLANADRVAGRYKDIKKIFF